MIGYETSDAAVWEQLTQGYPRFVVHPFVRDVEAWFRREHHWADEIVALLADDRIAAQLIAFVGTAGESVTQHSITAVAFPASPDVALRVKAFVQHAGAGVSSRRAEDFLLVVGAMQAIFSESVFAGDAVATLTHEVAHLYGAKPENVTLINFGMSAAYAAFCAVSAIQAKHQRTRWLQLGWLYLDTIRILEKFSSKPLVAYDVTDKAAIEQLFAEHGAELAGIVTEVPTNPLVQTVDLPWLYELAQKHGVAVVVDSTLGTPVVLDLLPYVDVAVESLTKFACGQGDAVGGAVVVNPHSAFAGELRTAVPAYTTPIYVRDAGRLATSIQEYAARMQQISANTTELIRLLREIPAITKIHHARGSNGGECFARLARSPDLTAGVISLEFNQPFAKVYDALDLPKGPSFGTEFTLVMSYLYLAHYDLVSTAKGREFLHANGLNPDLLRISVGLEDPKEIAEKIRQAVD